MAPQETVKQGPPKPSKCDTVIVIFRSRLGTPLPSALIPIQKLLFLYTQEEETEPTYDFVPYRFGGFSFTSYADKRRLIEQGFLADGERLRAP